MKLARPTGSVFSPVALLTAGEHSRGTFPGRPQEQGPHVHRVDLERRDDERRHGIAEQRRLFQDRRIRQTSASSEESIMINYGYVVYQAERTKSHAEQREADAQLGELAAAFAQLLHPLTRTVRAWRRQPGPGPTAGPCLPAEDAACAHGLVAQTTSPGLLI